MPPGDGRPAQPRLSVVVAAWTGGDELRRCLNSLVSQVDAARDEIIVARNFTFDGDATLPVGGTQLVDVVLAGATVPELRAAGLRRATGTIVAFIEDHCVGAPGWRDAIIEGHGASVAGVGGPVDLAAGGSPLDWAVYFYDYARYTPPILSGPARSLSGANMSWQRSFLMALEPHLKDEVRETVLHDECTRRGAGMYLSSSAIVVHRKRNAAGPAVRLAFAQAREYASGRVVGTGVVRRIAFAAAAVLLPVVLVGRIVAATLRSRRHLARLLVAAPWLLVLLVGWSLGEGVGYLAGPGGSRLQWR
jgi:hypothetical protein